MTVAHMGDVLGENRTSVYSALRRKSELVFNYSGSCPVAVRFLTYPQLSTSKATQSHGPSHTVHLDGNLF
jgi:hypothetical protein